MLAAELPISIDSTSFDGQKESSLDQSTPPPTTRVNASSIAEPPPLIGDTPTLSHQNKDHQVDTETSINHPALTTDEASLHLRRPSDPLYGALSTEDSLYGGMLGGAGSSGQGAPSHSLRQRKGASASRNTNNNHHQHASNHAIPNGRSNESLRRRSSSAQASSLSEPFSFGGMDSTQQSKPAVPPPRTCICKHHTDVLSAS